MQNHSSPNVPALSFNGVEIHDRNEMLCLTDMWRAQGADKSRQPSEWLESADGKRFCDTAAEILNPLKSLKPGISGFEENQLVMTKKGGNNAGTWAHWQIALAYAKYLSPEFHMQCNVVIRERMEGKQVIDPMQVLNDPAAMRGLLLTYSEKVIALEAKVEEQGEKVAALDRIATSEGSLCVTDAAKALQVRPKDLFDYLRAHNWVYRRAGTAHDIGYQARVNAGDLEHKVTTVLRADGTEKVVEQVRITPRGLAKLAKLMSPAAKAA